jgi:hypothetical protein
MLMISEEECDVTDDYYLSVHHQTVTCERLDVDQQMYYIIYVMIIWLKITLLCTKRQNYYLRPDHIL